MQRRAHESTSGVPVQWPVSVVQKPLGLRQSEKIPSKNFWVQRLEMAKQMKNIRQQRADERDKAAQIFTWCMVVAMHQEEGIGATRLERACNEMHEFQQRYRTKILTENRKSATDAILRSGFRRPRLRATAGKSSSAWPRTRAQRSPGWLWRQQRT